MASSGISRIPRLAPPISPPTRLVSRLAIGLVVEEAPILQFPRCPDTGWGPTIDYGSQGGSSAGALKRQKVPDGPRPRSPQRGQLSPGLDHGHPIRYDA